MDTIEKSKDMELTKIIAKCYNSPFFNEQSDQQRHNFKVRVDRLSVDYIIDFYKVNKDETVVFVPTRKFLFFTIEKGHSEKLVETKEKLILSAKIDFGNPSRNVLRLGRGVEKEIEELFKLFSKILVEEKEKKNKEILFKNKLVDIALSKGKNELTN